MTKFKIQLVIAFMTTALTGLIALQVYWISHDIQVKEEQFEQNVSMAMNNVVNKFEAQRALNNMPADFFEFDSAGLHLPHAVKHPGMSPAALAQLQENETAYDTMRQSRVHSSIRVFKKNNKEIITFFDNQVIIAPGIVFQKFRDNFDWDQFQSQDLYYYPVDPADENFKVHLKPPKGDLQKDFKISDNEQAENQSQSFSFNDTSSGSKVQVDYSSTVGKNFSYSYKTIQRKRDSLLKEFNGMIADDYVVDSARKAILTGREKVDITLKRYEELMHKIAFEFGQTDSEFKSKDYFAKLDTLIKSELQNYCVTLPYKYAVVNVRTDSVLYSSSPPDTDAIAKSSIRTQLYPNDIIQKPYMLMVEFPGKLRYVLANVWPVLISAAIFSLIIIFGFAYTIRIVLQQKKLADIKNDFINNMTHEFKTPIATIALAADSIRNEKVYSDKEKLDFYTTIIKQENTRMNNQVTHVLQMAQLDKGELKLRLEDVNVHDVINAVLKSNHLQIENRDGVVQLQLDANRHVIKADATHIVNVINNLVDNAIKYSSDQLHINIKTWNNAGGVFIAVTDKGMGMSHETAKRIFEKFYRATTGNLHDVKGFGLGLSYAKAIVDAHDGTIEVKSEKDKGSTFTVFLPFGTNS
ncbi:MAG: HAMP domain-containing sensor histidine kinase [Bacteroidia bacterium]